MKLVNFDYHLPKNLIAQEPVKPRDHSRLLVLDKISGRIEHKHFYDIADYLKAGDVLVLNNSKVFPARLIGEKAATGGKIEVFLLKSVVSTPSLRPLSFAKAGAKKRRIKGDIWQCLLGGHGRRTGLEIKFKLGLAGKVVKDNGDGTWEVRFNKFGAEMMDVVEKIGLIPLPPYIKRKRMPLRDEKGLPTVRGVGARNDIADYQTVYADDKKTGSVAAPTAGLHFTPALIKKLKNKGVQFEYITLHVGLGTFAPVKVDDITKHKMHAEMVEIKNSVAREIIKAKKEGKRVIAVGTTSVRTLEGCLSDLKRTENYSAPPAGGQRSGWRMTINNFIYPGYKFKIVDGLITNFHLPKSTLLMLVSAFARKSDIDKAYKEAIKNKYRFYSYGDAMFIY